MLLKAIVFLMMLAILASLGSALTFLLRRGHGDSSTRVARALTWRIGLSITLFLLLMAGYFFGIFTPHGLSPN